MEKDKPPMWKKWSVYVWMAWGSLFTGIVISVIFWLWVSYQEGWLGMGYHYGQKGERPPALLVFYLVVSATSALACLVGALSLFGIRSWRAAILIVPASVLGAGINGTNAIISFLSHALEGRNLGG